MTDRPNLSRAVARHRRTLVTAAVLGSLCFLTVAALHPLSTSPCDHLVERFDTLLNIWILEWDLHKLTTGMEGFFDANILFPYRHTLAFSEHMLGVALTALPLRLLGIDDRIGLFNLLLLISFPLSGAAVYLWARDLGASTVGSLLGAIVYAFSPWRLAQLGHFQLLHSYWTPLAMREAWLYLKGGGRRHLVLASLFTLAQALCSVYLAIFLGCGILLMVVGGLALRSWPGSARRSMALVAAIALAAVATAPLDIPYLKVRQEYGTDSGEWHIRHLSSHPEDFLTPAPMSPFFEAARSWLPAPHREAGPEFQVFPGVTAYLVLLLGLGAAPSLSRSGPGGANRREVGVLIGIALGALLFSLGPVLHVGPKATGIPMPYGLVTRVFPALEVVRAPSRFASITQLAVAMLVAIGWSGVERVAGRRRSVTALGLLLCVSAWAEPLRFPFPTSPVPKSGHVPEQYAYLERAQGVRALADLPMLHNDYQKMYFSTYHWKPMVNGVSGYLPRTQTETTAILNKSFGSTRSLDLLRCLGVSHVVLDVTGYPQWVQNEVQGGLVFAVEARFPEAWVLRLREQSVPEPSIRVSPTSTLDGDTWHPRLELSNTTASTVYLAPDVLRVKILTESTSARHSTTIFARVPFAIPPRTTVEVVLDAAVPTGPEFDWTAEWSGQSLLVRPGRAAGSVDAGRLRSLAPPAAPADRFIWSSDPSIFLDNLESGRIDGWSRDIQE